MKPMELDEWERRREFVKSLTPTERGVYADMVMRSLRGNWNSARSRAYILQFIAAQDEVRFYDSDDLLDEVDEYFKRIGMGERDGRFWRPIYQEADVDHTAIEEPRLRLISTHIPNDRTWDDHKINKLYEDDEGRA